MSAKRNCYIIVGPEGSGTYMMAEWLSTGGCAYIDDEEGLVDILLTFAQIPVVIRRSLPHRGKWIDIAQIGRDIKFKTDYDPVFIGIIREPFSTVESVENRSFQNRHEDNLFRNRMLAIRKMSHTIFDFGGEIVTYEAMVDNELFRRRLWSYLGLEWHDYPEEYEFYNRNLKYYE